jgi:hypothetical protein
MRTQRFSVIVGAGSGGRAIIVVPFDPDEAWGAKAVHHVGGTVNGRRVRATLSPGDSGWAFSGHARERPSLGQGPIRPDLGHRLAGAETEVVLAVLNLDVAETPGERPGQFRIDFHGGDPGDALAQQVRLGPDGRTGL